MLAESPSSSADSFYPIAFHALFKPFTRIRCARKTPLHTCLSRPARTLGHCRELAVREVAESKPTPKTSRPQPTRLPNLVRHSRLVRASARCGAGGTWFVLPHDVLRPLPLVAGGDWLGIVRVVDNSAAGALLRTFLGRTADCPNGKC